MQTLAGVREQDASVSAGTGGRDVQDQTSKRPKFAWRQYKSLAQLQVAENKAYAVGYALKEWRLVCGGRLFIARFERVREVFVSHEQHRAKIIPLVSPPLDTLPADEGSRIVHAFIERESGGVDGASEAKDIARAP